MIRKKGKLCKISCIVLLLTLRAKEGAANSVLILPAEKIQEFD